MKIVTKTEMAKLPRGTVFMDYHENKGAEMEEILVKDDYEFGATALIPDDCGEVFDFDWNLKEYRDDEHFWVFEEHEVLRMIKILMRGIASEADCYD